MKNLLILGYYGFENSGDDAILIAITNTAKRIDKDMRVTVLSNKPEQTKKIYGVNSVYRFNPYSIFKAVLKCDILLCGGGTLLQDGTSTRSLMYYLGVIRLANMLNKKVILYSNGIGPISKEKNLKLTRKIVNKVNTITLREESSRQYLEKIGVHLPKMLVTADPAFGLETVEKEEYKYIFAKNNIPMDKRLFGVSVREWKNKDMYYVGKIAQICDYIIENKNMHVVFLNMHNEHDRLISDKIIEKMKNKSYMIKDNLLPFEMLGVIANFKTMISMRLHGIIFAAKQRVPVAGLIYDPKVDYYLKTLKLPAIGNIDEIDIDKAIGIMNDLIDNNDECVRKLDNIVVELEKKEMINGEELKKLI